MQQLVKKNAQRPNINRVIIKFTKNKLWSHIIICPAYSLPLSINVMSSPSEITQSQITIIIHKNILRLSYYQFYLHIPMHNIARMQIL